jgi:hypothetical protein
MTSTPTPPASGLSVERIRQLHTVIDCMPMSRQEADEFRALLHEQLVRQAVDKLVEIVTSDDFELPEEELDARLGDATTCSCGLGDAEPWLHADWCAKHAKPSPVPAAGDAGDAEVAEVAGGERETPRHGITPQGDRWFLAQPDAVCKLSPTDAAHASASTHKPTKQQREYRRGLEAARRAILRKVPLVKTKAINEMAHMAGLDSASVYECAVNEVQAELASRIDALLARPLPAPPPLPTPTEPGAV